MVANSLSQLRPNGVIPVPMKLVALQIDSLHFLIRHLTARRYFRRSRRQVTFKPFAVVVRAIKRTIVS